MSFQEIIEFLNFLYALGMLLEFAAFVKLRIKKPDLHRPYKIPVGTVGAVLICIPPTFLIVIVMCLASLRTFVVSASVMVFGALLYFGIEYIKDKRWVSFVPNPVPSENCFGSLPVQIQETHDDASVNLLREP